MKQIFIVHMTISNEKKADEVNAKYEAFLKKYELDYEEGRFKVAQAVKYTDALFEKGRKELARHPDAKGFLGNSFAKEIIRKYNARYRLLWDNEDRDFAIDVIRMMIDFVNPDYDRTNTGVIELFESAGMADAYAEFCDKKQDLFKEAINRAREIDYSYYYARDISYEEYHSCASEARDRLRNIVENVLAECGK